MHATSKCIVIALPKSLVMSFVFLNLFGLYFMFCPFFIWFNFRTTFFQKTVIRIYHIFLCERAIVLAVAANCIQFHIIIMQKTHSSISWDNFQLYFVCSIILLHNVSLNSKVMERFLGINCTYIKHITIAYLIRQNIFY